MSSCSFLEFLALDLQTWHTLTAYSADLQLKVEALCWRPACRIASWTDDSCHRQPFQPLVGNCLHGFARVCTGHPSIGFNSTVQRPESSKPPHPAPPVERDTLNLYTAHPVEDHWLDRYRCSCLSVFDGIESAQESAYGENCFLLEISVHLIVSSQKIRQGVFSWDSLPEVSDGSIFPIPRCVQVAISFWKGCKGLAAA